MGRGEREKRSGANEERHLVKLSLKPEAHSPVPLPWLAQV